MPPFDQIRAWLNAYFANRLAKKTASLRARRNALIAECKRAKRQHRKFSHLSDRLTKLTIRLIEMETRK